MKYCIYIECEGWYGLGDPSDKSDFDIYASSDMAIRYDTELDAQRRCNILRVKGYETRIFAIA